MNGLASGLLNVLKFLEDTMPQSDAKIPLSTLSREAWVSITLCRGGQRFQSYFVEAAV